MVDDKEKLSMRNAIRTSQDTRTHSSIERCQNLDLYSRDSTWGVAVLAQSCSLMFYKAAPPIPEVMSSISSSSGNSPSGPAGSSPEVEDPGGRMVVASDWSPSDRGA